MMRFAADENFNGLILRGLMERIESLDIVRIQDTEMLSASDPKLLEWLAQENRVLLTHDVKTMPGYTYARVNAGQACPGVIAVNLSINTQSEIGRIIRELEVVLQISTEDDFRDQVWFV